MIRKLLLIVVLFFLPFLSFGQSASSYCFTPSTATYSPLTGTTDAPNIGATDDDAVSDAVSLGFSFSFGGTAYTQVRISSNGWVSFGSPSVSAQQNYQNSSANATIIKPALMPLWDDLANTSRPKYVVTGTAPNRIFKVEWSGQKWRFNSGNDVISFQVWMYETSNIIQYRYNRGANETNASASDGATIGIFDSNNSYITLDSSGANPTAQTATFTSNISSRPASNQVYTFTPPSPPTSQAGSYTFCIDSNNTQTGTINAGQYALVNVIKGFNYTFSIGDVLAGTENLILLDNSNANLSPNVSASGNGASITWPATYSGQLRVFFTGNCGETGGGTITVRLNSLGNIQDSQATAGPNNTWIGHIYNSTGASPSPFTNANYAGYYTINSEAFDTDFGGSGACIPVFSNGTQRASMYAEGFAVRYRMSSTRPAGCYIVRITGDDGVRLSINNGTSYVFDRWVEQGSTTYNYIVVNLPANPTFVLDYYENAGDNVVGFAITPFDPNSNTITAPATINFCNGGDPAVIDGSLQYNSGDSNAANPYINFQWQQQINGIGGFANISGATGRTYDPPAMGTNTTSSDIVYEYRRLATVNTANAPGATCTFNVSNIVKITNSPVVSITTQPQPLSICQGQGGSFTVATSNTNAKYQWQYSSSSTGPWTNTDAVTGISGHTSNTLVFTNTPVSYNGNFLRCVVSNVACSNTSNAVQLTVTPTLSAVLVTGTSPQSFCVGASGTVLTATETGGGTITSRQWGKRLVSGGTITNITSQTASTYTPTGANLGAGTWYVVCTSTPSCGSAVVSNETIITVNANLSAVSLTPNGDQALCATNSGTQLTAGQTGGGTITSRQWGKRSVSGGTIAPIPSETGSTYTPTGAVLGVGTWFIVCTSTPTCGSAVVSSEVKVTVSADIVANVSIAAVPNGAICSGTSVTFTATPTNGGSTPTYQWYNGSTLISGAIGTTYTSNTLVNSDPISVRMVSNATPCLVGSPATSNTIIMTVNPTPSNPTATVTTQPTCVNNTGTITVSSPVSGYGYSIDGSNYSNTSGVFTSLAPNTYSVTARNISTGCTSSAASVTINPYVSKQWNGSVGTSWSNPANWTPNGVPAQSDCVVIPNSATNKPIIDGSGTDFYAHTLSVGSTTTLTVNSNKVLNLTNEVTVNTGGSLIFNNNSSLMQSNKNAVNSGNITYIRETSVRRYDYTYWSSPLTLASNFKLNNMSPNTLADKYTSYDATGGSWAIHYGGGKTMIPGEGYSVRGPQNFDIVNPSIQTASFIGVPNNGDVLKTTVKDRFNLLGNPYPSAINAIKLIGDTNIGTIYFWTHNTQPSNGGSGNQYKYASADYASINLSGSTQNGGDANPPTGFIAAGQGFFAAPTTNSITFTNDMRVGGNNADFYKTAKTDGLERNRIWLNFTNSEGAFKQMLVGYIEGASNSWDQNYDAVGFNGNTYVDFYSINESTPLSIQGRALPFENSDVIPLGYKTTIAGDFKISIDHVDGLFNSQEVYLEDKKTGVIYDLKAGDYTFKTEIGTFKDRFTLRYTNKTLGTGDFENVKDGLLVSVKDKVIRVTSSKENIKDVTVFDITGKLIYNKKKVGSTELSISNLQSADQVLLVKVTLENSAEVTRKVIFK